MQQLLFDLFTRATSWPEALHFLQARIQRGDTQFVSLHRFVLFVAESLLPYRALIPSEPTHLWTLCGLIAQTDTAFKLQR